MTPDAITREAIRNMQRFLWAETWTFWPRRCRISHRRMRMFSKCYRGHKILNGPGEDILLVRWVSNESFTLEKLRGNI